MEKIDFLKAAREAIKMGDNEPRILYYRLYYLSVIEPVRKNLSMYKIGKFLSELEKEPSQYYDYSFEQTIAEIKKYSLESFGKPLLEWFNTITKEVEEIKKKNPYSYSENLARWRQNLTKLKELKQMLESFGLHADIEKRKVDMYARYNVVIEHHPPGLKRSAKECKPLMSFSDLEQQVLLPHARQAPLQLNGKFFPASEIKRFTITQSLLRDEEVGLYKMRHRCTTDLRFCNSFPGVTDKLIQNPHLVEAKGKNIPVFVEDGRIEALKAAASPFDLRKLIALCEELNQNWQAGNFYSVAYLSRALIDHVPPILGCGNFDEVSNNYGGDKSFKKAMEHLNKTLKQIADLHIHKQVSGKLQTTAMTQVDFRQDLDLLLAELLTKLSGPISPQSSS